MARCSGAGRTTSAVESDARVLTGKIEEPYRPARVAVLPVSTPTWAAYSPDGSRVAVVTGTNTVAVIDADGSPVSEAAVEGVDAWSPDGDRFVTLSHDEISVVDVVSGTVTMLPEARAALNGNRILGIRGFSHRATGSCTRRATGTGATGLWSISVDGSDARLVVAGTTQGEWQSR
jgi:WD40 repeat protein